jgi:hypothetical protein
VEGAGGVITNWNGQKLRWLPEIGTISHLFDMDGSFLFRKGSLVSSLSWRLVGLGAQLCGYAGEVGIEAVAAGNASLHEAALRSLAWKGSSSTS